MRRPVIAGNWKMYKTQAETRAYFAASVPLVSGTTHCDIVIAPPFTALSAATEATRGTTISISAQDVGWESEGAFTGQVSAAMLVEAGCRAVLVAHSEMRQFCGGVNALTGAEFSRIILAYEPVWAIGTGRTATPEIAAEAHRFLRQQAAAVFTPERASGLRILYGGSVKPDNIKGLMAQVEIDGALVGGASLNAEAFASIVNF